MPKSHGRKKKVYTPPAQKTTGGASTGVKQRHSAAWVPGVALGLAIVGMIWLVVFYLSEGALP
ncbi:MAG: cell division protein CrgA, partial [Pseudonocardiaceae bacterium]